MDFFFLNKKEKKAFKKIEIEWWPPLRRREREGRVSPWGRLWAPPRRSVLFLGLWTAGSSGHAGPALLLPRGPRVAVCSGPAHLWQKMYHGHSQGDGVQGSRMISPSRGGSPGPGAG